MATGMIEIMKIAAMDAIENGKPCDLRIGTVTSIAPLKVQITSNLIIPESLLVVPQYLTDYSVDMNLGASEVSSNDLNINVVGDLLVFSNQTSEVPIDDEDYPTEDTVDTTPPEVVDERTMTVYNSLKVGDKVALIRNQGGKMYYILDRV